MYRMLIAVIAALLLAQAADADIKASVKANYNRRVRGDKIVFAVIGDWGRIGGEFSGGTLQNCTDSATAYLNGVTTDDNTVGDACGGLQQLQAAKLMDAVCGDKNCQFVVNTGDNFYINGCYANDNLAKPESLRCAARFQNDWYNIYKTPATPALQKLPWINSLGNHDALGLLSGVNAQIAYQQSNPDWVLPARWYNADISTDDGPSIRFHVAHTTCFVKKYHSGTYNVDETQACATNSSRAAQLDFLNGSLNSSKATWDVVIAHHPGLSTAGGSYFGASQIDTTAGFSDAWQPFSNLVNKYSPVAYLNGHDHAMSYQYTDIPYNQPGGANILTGYPKTGFHTSGAGSWSQAADGGYKVNPFPFVTKFTNVDLDNGIARAGFLIVTATSTQFKVEYYSQETGKDVPFMVITNGKATTPQTYLKPYGVSHQIQWNSDGESIAFKRRKLHTAA